MIFLSNVYPCELYVMVTVGLSLKLKRRCASKVHLCVVPQRYNYALCLEHGLGIDVDVEGAFGMLLQAAEQGLSVAQSRLPIPNPQTILLSRLLSNARC